MNLKRSMFREYDIRGRETNEELSTLSLLYIGRSYGTFLQRRGVNRVVVGHDSRGTSVAFSKWFWRDNFITLGMHRIQYDFGESLFSRTAPSTAFAVFTSPEQPHTKSTH